MIKHLGSCLCKKVQFELTGSFDKFFLCHCSRCRKATGSAHCANLFSGKGVLTWITGREHVKTFNVEGTRFEKSFCTNCGAALPTAKKNGSVVVPAGSLDSPVEIKPNGHIFVGSKAAWDENLESVPRFQNLSP